MPERWKVLAFSVQTLGMRREKGLPRNEDLGGLGLLMPIATTEVLPCPPELRREALNVLYRGSTAGLRAQLVMEALEDAALGELDLSGLWIARRRGLVVGTLPTQSLAGHAAAFWPPEIALRWGRRSLAVCLLQSAMEDFRSRGFRIAQALLEPSGRRRAAEDLTAGGLPYVTDLIYLDRETATPLELPNDTPSLRWQLYDDSTAANFRDVLARTYEGSLDMPELEGIRSLDDVLASHRASGRFDPDHWRLAHIPSEPEAALILLLADQPSRDAWEVAYLGLTPQARGRGLGRAALAQALELSRTQRPQIELAVDARNTYAIRLYRSCGFMPFDRRAVHLALL